ncbi:peptidoglycan DD-metalloendopeptidase family protein [Crocinitomicaceae bacterium]|nr:peptidoglycan DD-metalloendopeptidase family protein [Crocinitomicaceae bacterium]
MKRVINVILFFSICFSALSQSKSDKLKREQKKLEKKITNTKSLLQKVSSNREASLNELKLIENQINSREALLKIYDNQVKMANVYIQEKNEKVKALTLRMERLKAQYKEMNLNAYKNRNKSGQMMFVLSADSYYEAQKRNKYLKSVSALHKKQAALIVQDQAKIKEEIEAIEIEKKKKQETLSEKRKERAQIEKDRGKKMEVLEKIQKEESLLLAEIRRNEIKKQAIKKKINEAIRRELAEIERKRKEAEKRRLEAAREKGETPKANTTSLNDESSEGKISSKKFQNNRGALPWPVSKGSITEKYGKNQHPSLSGVYTNNNGVDISCPTNSLVRTIFEGEVTSVFTIPGSGKVVIIKHGNYRTVYSNLKETTVSKGDKVKTKQQVGTILSDGNSLGLLHFEVHLVSGTTTKSLNPALWIDR